MGKTLEIVMKAVDKASDVFKKVGKAGEEAANKASGGSGGGPIRALNKRYRKSELASFLKLAKGAGAAGGISMIGSSFATVTNKINELNAGLASGEDNWASYGDKVAQSLPIIGGFATGIKNVLGWMTGLTAETERTNRETDVSNTVSDASKARAKLVKKLNEDMGREKFDLNLRMNLIGKDGAALNAAKAAQSAMKEVQGAEDKKRDRLATFDAGKAGELEKLQGDKAKAVTDDERADVQKKITMVTANAAADRVKIAASEDAEIAQLKVTQAAEEQDRLRRERVKSNEIIKQYSDASRDIYASTNAIVMRMNHDFFGAELAMLEKQTADKKAEIDKQLADQLKTVSPELQGALKATADANKKALDVEAQATRNAAERSSVDDAHLTILQMMASSGDAQAKAQLELLQATQAEYDLRKKLQDIAKDGKADPKTKADAQRDLAQLDLADKKRVSSQIHQSYITALEAQEKFGATEADRQNARRQLERTKIIDEAKERQAELYKIQNDPAATAAQKAKALQNFQSWESVQGKRFDDETRKTVTYKPLADNDDTHHLTALAAQAQLRAESTKDQLALTKDGNELLKTLNDNFDKYFIQNPPVQLTVAGE